MLILAILQTSGPVTNSFAYFDRLLPADYFIEYSHLSGDVARQGPDPLRQKPAPDSREGMLILKSCRNCVGPIFAYLYFAYLRS